MGCRFFMPAQAKKLHIMINNNENGSMLPMEFTNSGKAIRTVMEGDEPMFAGKDVFNFLDIAWKGSDSLNKIPAEWQGVRKLRTPRGGIQSMVLLNEAALYKIAFRSNKPEADAFTNWVAGEVLPAIRKYGIYAAIFIKLPIETNNNKDYFDYKDYLKAAGFSTRSGSVSQRIRKNPFEFDSFNGAQKVTVTHAIYISQSYKLKQYQAELRVKRLAYFEAIKQAQLSLEFPEGGSI